MAMNSLMDSEERLYMLEILVNQLNLSPNNFQTQTATPIKVVFKFAHLPPFSVDEKEILQMKKRKSQHGTIDFTSGQSFVFAKRPADFKKLIQAQPLKAEVYKTNLNSMWPEDEPDDELFLCETIIPLTGCLCDQFEMALNDQDHLPAPYEVRKTYELVDRRKQPQGTLNLFLRISCHGRSIVNEFSRTDTSLIFKNPKFPSEFQCSRILTDREKMIVKRNLWNNTFNIQNAWPRAKTVVGLSTLCEDLPGRPQSPREPPPKKILSREVVDKPKTLPEASVMDFVNFNADKTTVGLTNCHGRLCPRTGDKKCTDDDWTTAGNRLHGGGITKNTNDFGMNEKFPSFAVQSMQTLLSGACRPDSQSADKPGCGCYGTSPENGDGCLQKKCQGIDCLIRAFNNAQKFVDNIGKVKGMAGLGLMDPSESPYFRSRRTELPTSCSPLKSSNSRTSLMEKSSNHIYEGFNHYLKPYQPVNYHLSTNITRNDEKNVKKTIDNHRKSLELNSGGENIGDTKKHTDYNGLSAVMESTGTVIMPQKHDKIAKSTKSVRRKSSKKMFSYPSDTIRSSKDTKKVRKKVLKLVESAASGTERLRFGHRNCVDVRMKVPGNMGWLWNTKETAGYPKPQIGWKPGAILRRVWRILEDAKVEITEDVVERPVIPIRGKKSKTVRRKNLFPGSRGQWSRGEDQDDQIQLPPTLHVHRKNGTYYVTMYPVKAEFINHPELQETVKPLQFKVTKDRDDDSATSSSTASDMEFEFSPPVADTNWQKKEEVKDFSSQVVQQQILDDVVDVEHLWKGKKKGSKKR